MSGTLLKFNRLLPTKRIRMVWEASIEIGRKSIVLMRTNHMSNHQTQSAP